MLLPCWYSFELPSLVKAIQMNTHNTCFYNQGKILSTLSILACLVAHISPFIYDNAQGIIIDRWSDAFKSHIPQSGVAKVSCIFRHRGIQLILTYSCARPAILLAGKGRRGMFIFLLFLHFHSCSSFFPFPLFHLLHCLFSPFLREMTKNDLKGLCH